MTRSLFIGSLCAVVALAVENPNSSPTLQDVEAVAVPALAAPPAAETGPFGLPSLPGLPGLPGFGLLGPRPLLGPGGTRNQPQVNNKNVWQPSVGQPFQIILSSSVVLGNGNTQRQSRTPLSQLTPQTAQKLFKLVPERVDIFDIDLWDNSAETVAKLHASGKKVICYFSAGTSEDWRADFKNIRPQDMGAQLPLWKGERWLDIRQRSVWNVMQKRIELASKRGCDAIDPDNIDVYDNEEGGGFTRPLTKQDSITYVRRLAREARRYGMSIGLKNSGDILKSVQDDIQFAVNEECAELQECNMYKDFLYPNDRNKTPKPVFHIEYVSKQAKTAKPALNITIPKGPAASPPAPGEGTASAPLHPRSTTHDTSPQGPENGAGDPYLIFNKLWPNASAPMIRRKLCLGTPPTGVGRRMSTVIKEMNLGGWVMYCDGGWADTRTLLPNGQTPKKGASEGGKGGVAAKGLVTGNPFDVPAVEVSGAGSGEGVEPAEFGGGSEEGLEEGEEGEAGVGQYDPDLLETVLSDSVVEGVDDVWNSDVGPIFEEDLKPNPEKKSRGAGKDRRGPDKYAASSKTRKAKRRAVVYYS